MNATIINLTPHTVTVIADDGTISGFPSQGIARATQRYIEAGKLAGVRVVRSVYGAPIDLPDYEEGTYYIVSTPTVSSARNFGRTTADLLIPVDPIRNVNGQIIGCKALSFV